MNIIIGLLLTLVILIVLSWHLIYMSLDLKEQAELRVWSTNLTFFAGFMFSVSLNTWLWNKIINVNYPQYSEIGSLEMYFRTEQVTLPQTTEAFLIAAALILLLTVFMLFIERVVRRFKGRVTYLSELIHGYGYAVWLNLFPVASMTIGGDLFYFAVMSDIDLFQRSILASILSLLSLLGIWAYFEHFYSK